MKKSVELRRNLENIKNKIKELQGAGKVEEAHNMLTELEEVKNAIREAEIEEQLQITNSGKKDITNVLKIDVNRVFNKLIAGKSVTAEEMEAYKNAVGTPGQAEHTDEKGGYLVPEAQATQILEYKRTLISLKQYCDVMTVTTLSGKYPVEVEANDELTAFDELTEIKQSDINFAQKSWKVKDYGDIIPVSNTLLDDEQANLINYIYRRFGKKSTNTENKEIIAIMKTAAKKTGTTHDTIKSVLNKGLDPAISATSIIFTNQTSFDWLDSQKDANGHDLLQPSLKDPTQKVYKGRPIVMLPDEKLQVTKSKMEFWVGDMAEFIKFVDRKGIEIAVSQEAGFTRNTTLLRVIERFEVHKKDEKAMVYVEITPKEVA